MTQDFSEVLRQCRRLTSLHARLLAFLQVTYGTISIASDLAGLDGHAAPLQRDLLIIGAKALGEAEQLTQLHPDLEGWRDTLDSVGRDLDALTDALLDSSKAPRPATDTCRDRPATKGQWRG